MLWFFLQSVSVPDNCYDEFRKCPGFIKEYIFPGGCLPSLSRITSAMAAASTLWQVQHLKTRLFCALHRNLHKFLFIQCGAPWKHRSTLWSNSKMLAKNIFAESKVSHSVIEHIQLFCEHVKYVLFCLMFILKITLLLIICINYDLQQNHFSWIQWEVHSNVGILFWILCSWIQYALAWGLPGITSSLLIL